MSSNPVDVNVQITKMMSYLNLRQPQLSTDYTPEGFKCKLAVTVKNSDGLESAQLFSSPPKVSQQKAQESVYRTALRFMRDFYREDVQFQDFVRTNVHLVDRFVPEGWFSELVTKHFELQRKYNYVLNEESSLHVQNQYLEEKLRIVEMATEVGVEPTFQSLCHEVSHLRLENERLRTAKQKMLSSVGSAAEARSIAQHPTTPM